MNPLDHRRIFSQDAHMPRLSSMRIVILAFSSCVMLAMPGCETITGPKQPVVYSNLPSRAVQAVYPAEFSKVYAASQRVVQDELGYTLSNEHEDTTTGRAGFEGASPDGSTVRVEMERSRDLERTSVTVFAVQGGSTTANSDIARDILERIENIVAPAKK